MKRITSTYNRSSLLCLIAAFLICALPACGEDDLWPRLADTTWQDFGGLGQGLVFYETTSGARKAIQQSFGSGLPITRSVIHEIRIEGNRILRADTGRELFVHDPRARTVSGASGFFTFVSDRPRVAGLYKTDRPFVDVLRGGEIDAETARCLRISE